MPHAHPPHRSPGWHLCLPLAAAPEAHAQGAGWRECAWGLLLARFLVLLALPAGGPSLQPQPLDQPGAAVLPEPASQCPVGGPGPRTASALSLEAWAQLVGSELASLPPVAILPTPACLLAPVATSFVTSACPVGFLCPPTPCNPFLRLHCLCLVLSRRGLCLCQSLGREGFLPHPLPPLLLH